jgi:hypothetical protein
MSLADVSSILWRERQLLEQLLFKLTEEQMLLAAGQIRWIVPATNEVEIVLDEINRMELVRAMEVQAVGTALRLGPNPSLRELADAAPAPWDGMLMNHREAFLSLTDEITQMARVNRELLTRGDHAVRQVLDSFSEADHGGLTLYSAKGQVRRQHGALVVDEAL